ncbi:hypothetical protein J6590_067193 [Homalodisca vitripennis]|nr:hypothetical protein J6590_067193 [Homalodisca vitripennis]
MVLIVSITIGKKIGAVKHNPQGLRYTFSFRPGSPTAPVSTFVPDTPYSFYTPSTPCTVPASSTSGHLPALIVTPHRVDFGSSHLIDLKYLGDEISLLKKEVERPKTSIKDIFIVKQILVLDLSSFIDEIIIVNNSPRVNQIFRASVTVDCRYNYI